MSNTNDYQGCLRALSRAISQSVVAVQLACTPADGKRRSSVESTPLLDSMRGFYAQSMKPFFDAKKADDAVEREVGAAYGAMITHLQALTAGWDVFSKSNNKHIDLNAQSQIVAEQAIRAGKACYDAAVEALARLMKSEADARMKAETFIEMVAQYVQTHGHLYYSNPHYRGGLGGYTPHHVFLSEQTRKVVRFEFMYWDGADMISPSLGALFALPAEQKILERIAKVVYGPSVRIGSDYSSIEIDEAV